MFISWFSFLHFKSPCHLRASKFHFSPSTTVGFDLFLLSELRCDNKLLIWALLALVAISLHLSASCIPLFFMCYVFIFIQESLEFLPWIFDYSGISCLISIYMGNVINSDIWWSGNVLSVVSILNLLTFMGTSCIIYPGNIPCAVQRNVRPPAEWKALWMSSKLVQGVI